MDYSKRFQIALQLQYRLAEEHPAADGILLEREEIEQIVTLLTTDPARLAQADFARENILREAHDFRFLPQIVTRLRRFMAGLAPLFNVRLRRVRLATQVD